MKIKLIKITIKRILEVLKNWPDLVHGKRELKWHY
jgi:hypothetical protein